MSTTNGAENNTPISSAEIIESVLHPEKCRRCDGCGTIWIIGYTGKTEEWPCMLCKPMAFRETTAKRYNDAISLPDSNRL